MWSALLCRGFLGGPGAGGGARYGLYPQLTKSTRLGTRGSADSVFGGEGEHKDGHVPSPGEMPLRANPWEIRHRQKWNVGELDRAITFLVPSFRDSGDPGIELWFGG